MYKLYAVCLAVFWTSLFFLESWDYVWIIRVMTGFFVWYSVFLMWSYQNSVNDRNTFMDEMRGKLQLLSERYDGGEQWINAVKYTMECNGWKVTSETELSILFAFQHKNGKLSHREYDKILKNFDDVDNDTAIKGILEEIKKK